MSWAQQAVGRFFEGRKYPTKVQCDQIARSVSGGTDVCDVGAPGSMSYTIICKGDQIPEGALVVSFREPQAPLDHGMVQLARAVHGTLVPEVSRYGVLDSTEPPLSIYTMSYMPGVACVDALACEIELNTATEAKHARFVQDLARYFARCWSKPQNVTVEARAASLIAIQRRLAILIGASTNLDALVLPELKQSLPALFAEEYPQVLTHGDLSQVNILVDEDTYKITGIVDWSRPSILPFGVELHVLLLMTGYMDLSGWHDYACRPRLLETFWDTFWSATAVEDRKRRDRIRDTADRAGRIGAVLFYAFKRTADGSPSEALASEESFSWKYLQACFAS